MHHNLYPACTKIDTLFSTDFHRFSKRFLVQTLISQLFNCNEIKGAMSLKRAHENQRETCFTIGTYFGLIISFLYSNYTNDSI